MRVTKRPSSIRCVPVAKGTGTPITVLCGFLGSGKTTLLRNWKLDATFPNSAFIINDLNTTGVDAALVSDKKCSPEDGQVVGRVAGLLGKHSQAEFHSSVGNILGDIAELKPDPAHVFCESTGNARPWSLIAALTQSKQFHLRHFIVTIDALHLHRDFADGHVFTGEAKISNDYALQHAAEIIAEQILFASAIILTKTDTVSKTAIDAQIRILSRLRPKITIGLSSIEGFSLSHLDVAPFPKRADMKIQAERFGLTMKNRPQHVATEVINDPRPFHPKRLFDVFREQLRMGIYRTKGTLWLASRSNDVLLWQQANSQIGFEVVNSWADDDISGHKAHGYHLDKKQVAHQNSHPVFGNRMNRLTIVGLPNDCKIFEAALRSCLCTESEIRAWQNGESFPDPWPQRKK